MSIMVMSITAGAHRQRRVAAADRRMLPFRGSREESSVS
jgi:hypothetical protein